MMMMMITIYLSCIDVDDIPGFSFLLMKFDIFVVQDEYVTYTIWAADLTWKLFMTY